jgi:hypothetical protein
MSASSNEQLAFPAKLVVKQVQGLLEVLSRAAMKGRQFIEYTYREHGHNFEATVNFMQGIGWARLDGDDIVLTPDGRTAASLCQDDLEIRKVLAERLARDDTPYQSLLACYFENFITTGAEIVYRPLISSRIKESPLRNFLMDLGLVTYRADGDSYVLAEAGVELFVWAKNFNRPTSRNKFEISTKQREELGYRAELSVLAFERDRVGSNWGHEVEHVSEKRPFASYDIKSVNVHDGKASPIYIEVKAVPIDSYQFYWTQGELQTAQLLKQKYYLYLVPVVDKGVFDLSGLLIVKDPYTNVFQNSGDWDIEQNVIVCRKREPKER